MTRALLILIAALAVTALAQDKGGSQEPPQSQKAEWNFDKDEAGKAPGGWRVAETKGSGKTGKWTVVADESTATKPNVLKLETQAEDGTFNLCIAEKSSFKDLDLRVRVRANNGKEDQGGGPIWRCKDENNYYICRINPLENNFRVYKVENGRRSQLKSETLETKTGQWYEVRVVMVGDKIECYVDGKKYLEATDETFKDAGMVGLWTKADASSSFDNVVVQPARKRDGSGESDDEAAAAPSHGEMLTWLAEPTGTAPTIDGVMDATWQSARPLEVTLREAIGGGAPRRAMLRAMHKDGMLYVLAQWDDPTRSDMRDPYVWNNEKREYERPTKPDDQFALEFRLSGDFELNMLAIGKEYVADVWHWKAGRGNPNGWVDDKRHIISVKPIDGGQDYTFGKHGKVYIARPMDAGTPSYVAKPKPVERAGDVIDSFQPQEPAGSLADIRGKGVHDGRGWTLEMSRKFNTGHVDDAGLAANASIHCAVAILDDELYWNHSVSSLLRLEIKP